LEKLYKDKNDQGFEVLGFPSGDFGGQEFNNADKIESFCQINYGVTFPMFEKIKVKGKDAHPFYKQLVKEANSTPKWNFHKYLIGRDGKVIDSYLSWTSGNSKKLRNAVEAAL
jgi:glutathione peroxidase